MKLFKLKKEIIDASLKVVSSIIGIAITVIAISIIDTPISEISTMDIFYIAMFSSLASNTLNDCIKS